MSKPATATLQVEQLERFGKSLTDVPKEAFEGQRKVIFAMFRKKFGLLGMIPFAWRVFVQRRHLLKRYAKEYRKISELAPSAVNEITMLIAMFNAIARLESREEAYAFVKSIFQGIAVKSLSAIYQVDKLVQCEGDVFENFKKFNIAMFEAGNRDFNVQKMEDKENHLRIIVDRCLNVEIGKMFDCPEISMLGCDHDVAAYPHIEPKVHGVFRRPCTLAKGGNYCDFNFYREGFAPTGPYENM